MAKNYLKTEEIGIRQLKTRASELVRSVKEKHARYVITRRGKPAALMIPLDTVPPEKSADLAWERLAALGKELSGSRKSKKSAVEILAEMRR
jgi:prevent-host-death family protein